VELICDDNLAVLGRLPDGGIDLVYVDPPFGTGTTRQGRDGISYDDPADHVAWLQPRLAEMHRVLASTGSLFVHLDWRSVHYVKVALDGIFGPASFLNEIVWCYTVGGKSRRMFARKHDTILWYAKDPRRYRFFADAVRVPRKAGSHMKLTVDSDGNEWQVKRDGKTGKEYRYRVSAGKIPEDYWTDIETLNWETRERTGYPTQKPERLLERIVRATTAPGDLVADFFCGSGTTAAVAHRLGRRVLAVDASPAAMEITKRRLQSSSPAP
jgi:DNA modification methylase